MAHLSNSPVKASGYIGRGQHITFRGEKLGLSR